MTEPKEPTAKQWKRRALHAEQQVELLQNARAMEPAKEMRHFREIAALRVAVKEAQEALSWAMEQQT